MRDNRLLWRAHAIYWRGAGGMAEGIIRIALWMCGSYPQLPKDKEERGSELGFGQLRRFQVEFSAETPGPGRLEGPPPLRRSLRF